MRRFATTFGVALLASIVFVLATPGGAWVALAVVALAGALVILARNALSRVERRLLDELGRGYTTLNVIGGGLWLARSGYWKGSYNRMPWDLSGSWHLGTASPRQPDRSKDPAGIYPSPYESGRRELWTGVVWSGRFYD